ncbi:MAG: phosphotransferase [Anaerolineales bacterium]|nr:phosphotransferase [Anaerolineales bacterium]
MEQIRVARSFIAADSLAEIVAENYNLDGPVSLKMFSKLLRTQDNDHYRVTAGNDSYVLRVYQNGDRLQRQESDYLFEMDWLNFLQAQDIQVSYPLPRKGGSYLGTLDAPEGKRHYALFTLAPGKGMSTTNQEQLYAVGQHMAKIHIVSNSFKSKHQRTPIDLDFLLDKPLARIRNSWGPVRSENLDILLTSAEEALVEITGLFEDTPDDSDWWGVIGGDFHNLSVHFKENQPTFFNFDLCGYGWRAYDVAAFLSNTGLLQAPEEYSEAFFAGYYAIRPLAPEEHAAVSPFLTLRRVWRMGLFALSDGLAGYTFLAPA